MCKLERKDVSRHAHSVPNKDVFERLFFETNRLARFRNFSPRLRYFSRKAPNLENNEFSNKIEPILNCLLTKDTATDSPNRWNVTFSISNQLLEIVFETWKISSSLFEWSG